MIFIFQDQLLAELKQETAAIEKCESSTDWFSAASQRQSHVDKIQKIKSKLNSITKEEERIKQLHQRRKQVRKQFFVC